MRTVKRGTGITQRLERICESGEDIVQATDEWREDVRAHGGEFAAMTADIAERARVILDGTDAPHPEDDSPEYFARMVLKLISIAGGEVEEGNADAAARYAFMAGQLSERARMKHWWEPDADRGQRVAGGARNSAHEQNQRHVALREQRFSEMQRLVPKLGITGAARHLEARGLGSWQAIKRQWERSRKSRDT